MTTLDLPQVLQSRLDRLCTTVRRLRLERMGLIRSGRMAHPIRGVRPRSRDRRPTGCRLGLVMTRT